MRATPVRQACRRPQALLGRGLAWVGEEHRRWLMPLCQHLASLSGPVWQGMTPPELADHLAQRPGFDDAWDPEGPPLHLRRLLLRPARMTPPPFALEDVPLPAWHTVADPACGP